MPIMILFCSDPLNDRRVDPNYLDEYEAANKCGLRTALIDFEALTSGGNAHVAIRRIRPGESPAVGYYRGWMLTPAQYAELYAALANSGVMLVNTPAQYEFTHCLPRWYATVAGHTPRSVWTEPRASFPLDVILSLLATFTNKPVIVKDYVKSRKHEWHEACYIPDASDIANVNRVVARFLELVGANLNEGLVFREFVELEKLANHSLSGMPLCREFRLVFLNGELVDAGRYWDEGEYGETSAPTAQFVEITPRIQSEFFTMDVARRSDGAWTIIELGDGQVAQLPAADGWEEFYRRLSHRSVAAESRIQS
jgi:hypothetical protein